MSIWTPAQAAKLDLPLIIGDDATITFAFVDTDGEPIDITGDQIEIAYSWLGGGGKFVSYLEPLSDSTVVWRVDRDQSAAIPKGPIADWTVSRISEDLGHKTYVYGKIIGTPINRGSGPGDQALSLRVNIQPLTVTVTVRDVGAEATLSAAAAAVSAASAAASAAAAATQLSVIPTRLTGFGVPRLLKSKQDTWSIRDFGDEQAGLRDPVGTSAHAVMSKALNSGENIYFPPGIYPLREQMESGACVRVNSGLSFDVEMSMRARVLAGAELFGTQASLIKILPAVADARINGGRWSGGIFDGSQIGDPSGTGCTLMDLYQIDGLTVRDTQFTGGVLAPTGTTVGQGQSCDQGLATHNCTSDLYENLHFEGFNDLGLYVSGDRLYGPANYVGERTRVSVCTFWRNNNALSFKRGAAEIQILGVDILECGNGIQTTNTSPVDDHGRNVSVLGGRIRRIQGRPIRLSYGVGDVVSGVHIYDWGATVASMGQVITTVSSGNLCGAIELYGAQSAQVSDCAIGYQDWPIPNDTIRPFTQMPHAIALKQVNGLGCFDCDIDSINVNGAWAAIYESSPCDRNSFRGLTTRDVLSRNFISGGNSRIIPKTPIREWSRRDIAFDDLILGTTHSGYYIDGRAGGHFSVVVRASPDDLSDSYTVLATGRSLSFDSGGTTPIVTGDTITGSISGATATATIVQIDRATVQFTGIGTSPIARGDILNGATSGAAVEVIDFAITSGSWAAGNAVGTLKLAPVTAVAPVAETFSRANVPIATVASSLWGSGTAEGIIAYEGAMTGTFVASDNLLVGGNDRATIITPYLSPTDAIPSKRLMTVNGIGASWGMSTTPAYPTLPAPATDLASAISVANACRALLVGNGLGKA